MLNVKPLGALLFSVQYDKDFDCQNIRDLIYDEAGSQGILTQKFLGYA